MRLLARHLDGLRACFARMPDPRRGDVAFDPNHGLPMAQTIDPAFYDVKPPSAVSVHSHTVKMRTADRAHLQLTDPGFRSDNPV